MDDKLGIGAFKFQSVVSNEMKLSKDPRISMTGRLKHEARKSIIDKCKHQFQNAKKKIIQRLQDPQEKDKFQEEVKRISEEIINTQNMDKKKLEEQFVLKVSETSSSNPSSDDSEKAIANGKVSELVQASQNMKRLLSNKMSKSLSNSKASPRNSVTEMKKPNLRMKLSIIKNFKAPPIKKEIQFLRSLQQNQKLQNNENLRVDEYKIDREIFVDMDCKDIMTYMRLQHEVEELRRKQTDLKTYKELHYGQREDGKKRKKPHESEAKEENKLLIITLAKRFYRKFKEKTKQNLSMRSISMGRRSSGRRQTQFKKGE